ncbi:Tfp pilus assembly protein, ATPase PilM [Chthonomonas calidirosea]|uniref:Tfp pilus assembly protein, ATPase PilM n=1 Tax=Chthonomonas calidirosea (strain DSM 23976 / ICMP 18418 / T49) TaxID=1303518 RepID=S0EWF6_CHTCT|nr:pilus assembly protein PilM [Chthonomonas calidirosea]CCW34033.1 Tfp pilus assembly protein, ATPase PilM [Chthonomonas calidirosea T49]CEK15949.1 Tfp pilus assembly protein, ATPase PilM [Chthonomonas calidirosea]
MRAQRSIVTIDLGVESIWVGEVASGASGEFGKQPHLLRHAQVALPAGVWENPTALTDALVETIRQALQQANISAKDVFACLPRHLAMLRPIQLPHVPPEELKGMVSFEAQQYILYPVDEAVLSYCLLEGRQIAADGAEVDCVLLAAMRKDLIEAVLPAFERLGLTLHDLTISSAALAQLGTDFPTGTALLFATSESMDLVVPDLQAFFTRGIALVGARGDEVAHADRVAEEVVRSLAAYQNEYRQRSIGNLYLLGGPTAFLELLRSRLLGSLDIAVEFYPWSAVLGQSDASTLAYARVIGLALQATSEPLLPINLIPAELAERRQRLIKQRLGFVGIGAAGIVIFLGTTWAIGAWQRHEQLQQETLEANVKLQKFEHDRLKPLQDATTKLTTVHQELQSGLDRSHPLLDILTALSQAMPSTPNIWLTQLSFTRNGVITLRGNAKKSSDAVALLLSLQRSKAFTDVQLSFMGDASQSSNGASLASTALPSNQPTRPSVNSQQSPSAPSPTSTNSGIGSSNSQRGVPAAPNGGMNGFRSGEQGGAFRRFGPNARPAGFNGRAQFGGEPSFQSGGAPGGPPQPTVQGQVPPQAPPLSGPSPNTPRGDDPPSLRTNETAAAPLKTLPSPLNPTPADAGTLTSFVITFRVNPAMTSLISQNVAEAAMRTQLVGGGGQSDAR